MTKNKLPVNPLIQLHRQLILSKIPPFTHVRGQGGKVCALVVIVPQLTPFL
jgi:hypothetical protein